MSVSLEVHAERRVVMLRWKRARHGSPHKHYPDLDDRGTRAPELAPIVGLMEGKKAFVRLVRELIAADAPLFVTSSEPGIVRVVTPADGRLPSGASFDVELEGLVGGDPHQVDIQVRFGSLDGPVIGRLVARCYEPLTVRIFAHVMALIDSDGSRAVSDTDIYGLMDDVNATWRPCGIRFVIEGSAVGEQEVTTPGQITRAEIEVAKRSLHREGFLNVYLVRQIAHAGVLGEAFSRREVTADGFGHLPGATIADRDSPSHYHDVTERAHTLAHELGHSMLLRHPNHQEKIERSDVWARRMLMFNIMYLGVFGDWRDDVGYGRDQGYGRAGAMVTQKALHGFKGDNECAIIRAAVQSGRFY